MSGTGFNPAVTTPHFYFGEDGDMTMVDQGETKPMTWTVLSWNDSTNELKIHVQYIEGHEKTLTFAPDYESLEETVEFIGIDLGPYEWHYADGKTKP